MILVATAIVVVRMESGLHVYQLCSTTEPQPSSSFSLIVSDEDSQKKQNSFYYVNSGLSQIKANPTSFFSSRNGQIIVVTLRMGLCKVSNHILFIW